MERRKYSEEEKQRVLVDVTKHGVCEAARRNGIPESCVSRWAKVACVVRGGSVPSARRTKTRPRGTTKTTTTGASETAKPQRETRLAEASPRRVAPEPEPAARKAKRRVARRY